MKLKEIIRRKAVELGFDDCRFTSAEPPDSRGHFDRWLAEGRHGSMGYLERNAPKRVDPNRILDGARTILCLASSYASSGDCAGAHEPHTLRSRPGHEADAPTTAGPPPHVGGYEHGTTGLPGVVARYARHADYHDVLADRLRILTALIQELAGPETKSLWYVDTGPLLERDLAQRAGVGFIGKHTNLISRTLGNWIFLSEIITTAEFTPDAPERNRCGSCTRCIAACPTAAIVAPFELDARRCISYLTIELKGSIPLEFRPAIGNRIYGCDDCLGACPWNRFAREGRLMRMHRRPDLETPELLELLSLDDAAFKQRFAGTPMLRTKRRGLLRNVCVALGNVGEESALPGLERAAADSEPLIREHAEWAIAEIRKRAQSKRTP